MSGKITETEIGMNIDLKKYALQALETAKEDLRRDKYLIPVAFIVTDNEVLDYNLDFEDAGQKASVYQELVEIAKQKRARAIITINDATVKNLTVARQNSADISFNRDVLQECIFVAVSGPAIQTWSVSVPYLRTNEGVLFGSPQETLNDVLNLLPGWASLPRPSS